MRNSARRSRGALVLAAALALTVTGCSNGSSTSGGSDSGETVEITQWYHEYGEEGAKEAVMTYAADYMKENPGVKVKVVWVPGDYNSKLNAAMLTGDGPDIFESAPIGERIFAGQVEPVGDLFGDALSDFNPKSIEAMTVEGKVYGVPMTDGTGMLFYRKSMLNKAGVQPPETMDELIVAAKALTEGSQKGLFIGNDGCTSGQLPKIAIWSAGSDIIKDGKVAFDNDRTAKAFTKMKELCSSDSLLLGAPQDWYDSANLIDGLVAMQWGGQWTLPQVEEALGDDFGVVPWPALDAEGTPATWYGGWYEQVNADSKNVQASKDFVKSLWIDNVAAQTQWATGFGSTAPVRASIVESTESLKSGPGLDFMNTIKDYGHLESGAYWSLNIEAAIGQALNNVIKNDADPASEISKAAQTAQTELDRIKSDSKLK